MSKKVSFDTKFLYAVFTVVSAIAASNLSYWLIMRVLGKNVADIAVYCLISVLMTAVSVILSWAIMFVFLYKKVPGLYFKSDDKKLWVKQTVSLILPGELARFIISVLTFRRYFDKASVQFYNVVYGLWADEITVGILNVIDYMVYGAVYVFLLAVFLLGIFFMYRRLWLLGKRDYENLYKTEA